MIVHLFEDEKFVDATIDNFDNVSEGENRYIIFSDSDSLKYVNQIKRVEIHPNSWKKLEIDLIFRDCKLLIIHYLSPIKLYILKHLPDNIKVIWSVWGGDAYSYFENQDIYESLTAKVKRGSVQQILKKTFLYDIYHFYKYNVLPINKERLTLRKINYLITVLPGEFEVVRKEFQLSAEYIDFNYGVNKFNQEGFSELGDAVLLGNSASYSNNHLDIFELIKETEKRLIVPLSYGGYQDYTNLILTEGEKRFNKLFIPITKFMPLKKYNKLVLSCNTVIMHHIRQQALGNIFMSLYFGVRVFLNKKSITYKYLKDVGMIIFNLENDVDLVGVELQEKQKIRNRELVIELRGKKIILDKIQKINNLYTTL
jgi:hypothetical protein